MSIKSYSNLIKFDNHMPSVLFRTIVDDKSKSILNIWDEDRDDSFKYTYDKYFKSENEYLMRDILLNVNEIISVPLKFCGEIFATQIITRNS